MTKTQQLFLVLLTTALIMFVLVTLTGADEPDLSNMSVVAMGMCLDDETRQEVQCAILKKALDPDGAYFAYLTKEGELDKLVRKECVQSKQNTLYRRRPIAPAATKQYPGR